MWKFGVISVEAKSPLLIVRPLPSAPLRWRLRATIPAETGISLRRPATASQETWKSKYGRTSRERWCRDQTDPNMGGGKDSGLCRIRHNTDYADGRIMPRGLTLTL